MPKNSIYVQTQTKENYKEDKQITSKQWKIYYYMLSVSKFNSQAVENHRYIYKKDFNVSECCRALGIKSTQTFYNAMKKLESKRLVRCTSDYYFLYAKNWIDVNQQLMSSLVKYSKTNESNIDLLRTFLILKKLNKIAKTSSERSFTLRSLITLLGHNATNAEYYEAVRIYLALLNFWGLIDIKVHLEYMEKFGKFTVYHLQGVSETAVNKTFEADIEAELRAPELSQEMMEKLKFSCPELLEDQTVPQ